MEKLWLVGLLGFFFPRMLLRLLAVGGGFFGTEINNHLSVLLVKLPL